MPRFNKKPSCMVSLSSLVLLSLVNTSCARKEQDERRNVITEEEVQKLPNLDDTPATSNEGLDYGQFSLSELDQNAPLDIVDMSQSDDSSAASRGFSLETLAPPGNSPGFRGWYAGSIDPEKSKYFSIACEKTQSTKVDRIVLVRLKDMTPDSMISETVAFRISRCDTVKYGLMNLEDKKMYNLSARVYKVRPDALDPDSSLFTTEQSLEGTSGVITKTLGSSLTYRRVVDSTAEKIDVSISENGQNENDPLVGGELKINVVRVDDTNTPKPVPNAQVTLTSSRFLKPAVKLTTNADGVAVTRGLSVGPWSVNVGKIVLGNFEYKEAISKIDVKANENLDHKITLQPFVYGWLFATDVAIKIGQVAAKVTIQAGINERPDQRGSHDGFAYPMFLNYCGQKYAELAKQSTKPEEKAAYEAIAGSLSRKEATLKAAYKFTSADQKQKIQSTDKAYLSTTGVQIMWTDKPSSAPFGASGSCTIQ